MCGFSKLRKPGLTRHLNLAWGQAGPGDGANIAFIARDVSGTARLLQWKNNVGPHERRRDGSTWPGVSHQSNKKSYSFRISRAALERLQEPPRATSELQVADPWAWPVGQWGKKLFSFKMGSVYVGLSTVRNRQQPQSKNALLNLRIPAKSAHVNPDFKSPVYACTRVHTTVVNVRTYGTCVRVQSCAAWLQY